MGLDAGYGIGSIKPGVCTSSTRPAAPFEGQTIYETDTDLVKSYNGTSWVTIGPTTSAVSAVDISRVNTSETTSSTTFVGLTTAQVITMTTGTKALVILAGNCTAAVNQEPYVTVAVSGATTIAASINNGASVASTLSGGYAFTYACVANLTLTAGSNTFTMQVKNSAAASATFYNRSMTVIAYS